MPNNSAEAWVLSGEDVYYINYPRLRVCYHIFSCLESSHKAPHNHLEPSLPRPISVLHSPSLALAFSFSTRLRANCTAQSEDLELSIRILQSGLLPSAPVACQLHCPTWPSGFRYFHTCQPLSTAHYTRVLQHNLTCRDCSPTHGPFFSTVLCSASTTAILQHHPAGTSTPGVAYLRS
jgi:hypothetical protein